MQSEVALDAVRIFAALVAAAALVAIVTRRFGIPDELGLLLVGLAAALVLRTTVVVTPELVLAVLLPGLVFEASYRLRVDDFRRSLWAVGLLAIPGVVLSAAVVAVVLNVAIRVPLETAFLVGAMVSATDPASVIAVFARLRAPSGLATLVQGESLLNDGTGIVLFSVALSVIRGTATVGSAAEAVVVSVTGSVLVGLALGFAASRVVATIDDYVVELTISLALAYGAYVVADGLRLSGIIATVVAGITLGNYGQRIGMSARTRQALDIVWGTAAFVLTALVFLLIGMAIRLDTLGEAAPLILWGTLAILVGRAALVYLVIGAVTRAMHLVRRSGIPMPWLHVMFWSGLRGAVAVAMALSLPLDVPERQLLQETVFGIVLITIIVQGTAAPAVIGHALQTEAPTA